MKNFHIRSISLLFILLILLLIMQQTLKVGGNTLLSTGIHNSAHGPWFALVTYLIWRIVSEVSLPPFKFLLKLSLTVLIASCIAFMSEFGEKIMGREASWEDFFVDMCGMVSVLLIIVSYKMKARDSFGKHNPVLLTIAGLLLVFSLYPFFFAAAVTLHHKNIHPRLLGFNSYLDYASMSTDGESQLITAPKEWKGFAGQAVMRIKLPVARWPGFRLNVLAPNWRSYSYLIVELFNDSNVSLPLRVSIRTDSLTDDGTVGFMQHLRFVPGANTMRVSIDDLLPDRVEIDWQVRYIIIYVPRSFAGRTIYVRNKGTLPFFYI